MDAMGENQIVDFNFVQYHNVLLFTNDSMPYLDYVITVVPLDKTCCLQQLVVQPMISSDLFHMTSH